MSEEDEPYTPFPGDYQSRPRQKMAAAHDDVARTGRVCTAACETWHELMLPIESRKTAEN